MADNFLKDSIASEYINKYLGITSKNGTGSGDGSLPIINEPAGEPIFDDKTKSQDSFVGNNQGAGETAQQEQTQSTNRNELINEERTSVRQQKAQALDEMELELLNMYIKAGEMQRKVYEEADENKQKTLHEEFIKFDKEIKDREKQVEALEKEYLKFSKESNPYHSHAKSNLTTSSADLKSLSNMREQVENIEKQRISLANEIAKAASAGDAQKVAQLHAQDSALEQDMILKQEDYLALCAETLGGNGFIDLEAVGADNAPILDIINGRMSGGSGNQGSGGAPAGMGGGMPMGNPMQQMMGMFMQMFQMQMMMQMFSGMFGGESSDNPFGGMMDMFSNMFKQS